MKRALLALALCLSACAADEDERAPPRGLYLPVPAYLPLPVGAPAAERAALTSTLPIFLNRYGGTYYGGYDDSASNSSSVVPWQSTTLSAFDGGDALWDDVVACVQDQFARFDVYVTDVEPASGEYVEAVVAGYPEDVGLPSGVGGVAPMDPYYCEIIPSAIVYVFALALPLDAGLLCEIAAQEIAHAFSLDHELLCEDPMTYLDGCGAKSFQDAAASCGEYSARECACGRPSQNSVEVLYEKLGASDGSAPPPSGNDDDVAPSVTVLSPAGGATLAGNGEIQVVADVTDAGGLASVTLDWDYSGDRLSCPASEASYSCTTSGARRTWTLNVGTGARSFRVSARDYAGNVKSSTTRTITLTGDGAPDGPDEGDPWDVATPLPCSTGLDVTAAPGVADWFVVSVSPGVEVSATLTSRDGAELEMALTEGLGAGDVVDVVTTTGTVTAVVVAEHTSVGVRVTALDETGGYRVVVSCDDGERPRRFTDHDDPDPPPAAGGISWCAQSGPSPLALLALAGLAAFAPRRQRRRASKAPLR